MKRLANEAQVRELPDTPGKRAMVHQIENAHGSMPGVHFDAVADCGGGFYLFEPGDSLTAFEPYEGAAAIDLTDFDGMCYEQVEMDGTVYVLLQILNDAGGRSYFIPDEPWIGDPFRQRLAGLAVPYSGSPGGSQTSGSCGDCG